MGQTDNQIGKYDIKCYNSGTQNEYPNQSGADVIQGGSWKKVPLNRVGKDTSTSPRERKCCKHEKRPVQRQVSSRVLRALRKSHKCFFFLSIFFSFIFIIWKLITLQYCSGFCHTLTWISHGFTRVPHPDPPSRLPPHPIPLGLPSAPALSWCIQLRMHPTWAGDLFHPRCMMSHASDLGRWSVSPSIVYLFQCYSLRTSHPRLKTGQLAP